MKMNTGITLRPELHWFAGMMEKTLRKHDAEKGVDGWKNENMEWLYDRLREEALELEVALLSGKENPTGIIKECCDVANIAMMIADLAYTNKEAANGKAN